MFREKRLKWHKKKFGEIPLFPICIDKLGEWLKGVKLGERSLQGVELSGHGLKWRGWNGTWWILFVDNQSTKASLLDGPPPQSIMRSWDLILLCANFWYVLNFQMKQETGEATKAFIIILCATFSGHVWGSLISITKIVWCTPQQNTWSITDFNAVNPILVI